MGNEKRIGKGTLYISEARVTWEGDASAANHTFSLEYNHISVHAISRDAMVFPHTECLYLMIDAKLVDSVPGTPASTPETSDDDDEADDGEGMTEIRLLQTTKRLSRLCFHQCHIAKHCILIQRQLKMQLTKKQKMMRAMKMMKTMPEIEMAMAFLTMLTRLATMVIITANLWRNRDLLDLKISDLILELPGQATNMNKNIKEALQIQLILTRIT